MTTSRMDEGSAENDFSTPFERPMTPLLQFISINVLDTGHCKSDYTNWISDRALREWYY